MITLPALNPSNALLLSAYDAVSHRYWREQVTGMLDEFRWQQLTLPPRHFNWRVRGNSLSWGFGERNTLENNYQLLVCTSMVDLASLRGFVPALARLPTIVYVHENQFAYPGNNVQQQRVEPQITSLYTALCADRLIFNSHHNRDTFLQGSETLLKRLPDHVPAGLVDRLSQSQVLPVPLNDALFITRAHKPVNNDVLTLVWNHRWEHDKGPELLLAIVRQLINSGVRFRLHLLGQQFRQSPPSMLALQKELAAYCLSTAISPGHIGFIADPAQYYRTLAQADVVLSTANHDFQGLSILEATALGCTPLAPARLAYPEYLPESCLYHGDSREQQALSAAARLTAWAASHSSGRTLPATNVQTYAASAQKPAWQRLVSDLLMP